MQETLNDKLLCGIKKRIQQDNWQNCTPAEQPYKKNREGLSVEDHVVILGTRPVVPKLLQKKLIETAHETHFGISTTKMVLKQNVWWSGMDKCVEEYIRSCEICKQKPKSNFESNRHRWEPANKPFERIHLDWAQVSKIGTILIIVDAMSGWPEAIICQDRSAATVKKILQTLFARYGVPQQVVTDNAKEFVCEELAQWLIHVGAQPVQTPQYHACSNGLVERMVQTVKRVLKIYSAEKGDVHTFLQKCLMTYRSSRVTNSRGRTPAELFLGREIRNPLVALNTDTFIYTPKPGEIPMKCKFLVQNSDRTAYVDCDGITRLAHIDQLKEIHEERKEIENEDNKHDEEFIEDEESIPDEQQNNGDIPDEQETVEDGNNRLQRRRRNAPVWMKDYVVKT